MSDLSRHMARDILVLRQELGGLDIHVKEPVEEYRFHPVRRWRFDFAWPEYGVAVEVEGGTWVRGAHTRGKHFESDCEKYNEAARMKWRVFRFTTDMIKDGRAFNFLAMVLRDAHEKTLA